MMYKVEKHSVWLSDGKQVHFEYPIRVSIECEGVIVVVLDVPAGVEMSENVFGVSMDGRILWQIERIPETGGKQCQYLNFSSERRCGLWIWNWCGWDIEVDPRTGKVLSRRWCK